MRPSLFAGALSALSALLPTAHAERLIESKSLNPCMANSSFSATLFNVVFTPDNATLTFNIVGVSDISGNVTADLEVFAYGYRALKKTLDPCSSADLKGLCPMNTGQINIESNVELDPDTIKNVPSEYFRSSPELRRHTREARLSTNACRHRLHGSRSRWYCANLH